MHTTTTEAILRAADTQEQKSPGWGDAALRFLREYARDHKTFLTEDVRNASLGFLDEPKNTQAWGRVMLRAKSAGIIAPTGTYAPMKAAHSHSCPKMVWESNVYAKLF